ncbi:MAG: ParB/RepB/Spo0J family partition protein [Nitrosospira sp.]
MALVPAEPVELDLSLIDEDPHQPRTEFNQDLIRDMAKTIEARGVKNPISVHRHPTDEGRYMINDGARRYRASKLAGKTTIPAFIDSDFTKIDQVIVNAHHESFTPREWSMIMDQELKNGRTKGQIARDLAKSPAFVTDHLKLLSMPDSIAEVFNSNRCTDVTVLSELAVMRVIDAQEVDSWLRNERQLVSRGTVRQMHAYMKNRAARVNDEPDLPAYEGEDTLPVKQKAKRSRAKKRKVIVQVQHEGRMARLNMDKPMPQPGAASFTYEDDGVEFECPFDQVQIVGFQ